MEKVKLLNKSKVEYICQLPEIDQIFIRKYLTMTGVPVDEVDDIMHGMVSGIKEWFDIQE